MAITSRRTGLTKSIGNDFNTVPRSELIWLMQGSTGIKESNIGIGSDNSVLGDALNAAGNRGATRLLPRSRNVVRVVGP